MPGFAWVFWVGWTLVGLGAASLLVWIVGRSARGQRRCPTCDYDLSATPGLTCPECGKAVRSERALFRRRRRRGLQWVGAALVAAGGGALVFSPHRRDGWASSVPDWIIWPLTTWFESDLDGAIRAVESTPPARWERALRTRRYVVSIQGNPLSIRLLALNFSGGPEGADPHLLNRGLLDLAEDPQYATVRASLLDALDYRPPFDAIAGRRVRPLMNDGNHTTWLAGFEFLQRTTVDRRKLHTVVIPALRHQHYRVRGEAVSWLGYQDAGGAFALDELEDLRAHDPDLKVRQCAEIAIASIRKALVAPGGQSGR